MIPNRFSLLELNNFGRSMSIDTDKSPEINKTAFCCPHCNAYTTQHWSTVYLEGYSGGDRTPTIPDLSDLKDIENNSDYSRELKNKLVNWVVQMNRGKPFIELQDSSTYSKRLLSNVNCSECYNCNNMSIWIHNQLIYPNVKIDIQPNQDLPAHVKQLFEEAREIVAASPKGAAALLRLCIQYLCIELGQTGKYIDKDIASLVSNGLDPLVQQSLDIVRVIGNEAVHPGEINLNDNREIAHQLFNLVNIICNQMITQPKQVKALYEKLPKSKIEGIENRDKKTDPKSL